MSTHLHIAKSTVVAGRYEIDQQLSRRGDGLLYSARDLERGESICLGIVDRTIEKQPDVALRLSQAMDRLLALRSPHLVRFLAHGIGSEADLGLRPWIAMELLAGGQTLEAQMKLLPPRGSDAMVLLRQIAQGLSDLHAASLVHGQLKPSNIYILRPAGESQPHVKILGVAMGHMMRLVASDAASDDTGARQPKVTPMWMAPEQAEGQVTLSPATDVFTLGLLAFYLFARRSYWRAVPSTDEGEGPATLAILNEVLARSLVPASARAREFSVENRLPEGFDHWFARCVHRQPQQRFPDAAAALQAMDELRPRRTHSGAQSFFVAASALSPAQKSTPSDNPGGPVSGSSSRSPGSSSRRHPLRRRLMILAPILLMVLAGMLWGLGQLSPWLSARQCEALLARGLVPMAYPEDAARSCGVSCERGRGAHCRPFADWLLAKKARGPQSAEVALVAYQKGCAVRDRQACRRTAELLDPDSASPSQEVRHDVARARHLYEQACDLDDVAACKRAGQLLMQDPTGIPEAERFDRVIARWGKACSGGDLVTCVDLGKRQLHGNGLPKNAIAAAGLFKQACDAGSASGCFELARQQWQGLGVARDRESAALLLRKACEGRHDEACMAGLLSRLTLTGDQSLSPDELSQLRQACERRNEQVCTLLGLIRLRGWGLPADTRQALEQWQNSCRSGSSVACMAALVLLESDWSTVKSAAQAAQWRQESCRDPDLCLSPIPDLTSARSKSEALLSAASDECMAGQPAACLKAARLSERRGDLRRERERRDTLDLYQRACSGMVFDACIRGGLLGYWATRQPAQTGSASRGSDTARQPRGNDASSKDCTRDKTRCSPPAPLSKLGGSAASDADVFHCGNAETCVNMGVFYKNGLQNLPRDPARAAQAFRQACELNNAEGCFRLSLMLRQGEGGKRDAAMAQKLLEQACRFSYAQACGLLVSDQESACHAGQAQSCVRAGLHFLRGDGVPQDVTRGRRLLRQGCSKQRIEGCEHLGAEPPSPVRTEVPREPAPSLSPSFATPPEH